MKFAIVLVIVGGAVILTPPVLDHLSPSQHQAFVSRVLETSNMSVENKLAMGQDAYPFWCLMIGASSVVLGVAIGVWSLWKGTGVKTQV